MSTQKLDRVFQTTLTVLMVRESLREVRVRERSRSDFTEMHRLELVRARNAYRVLSRGETNSVRIGVLSLYFDGKKICCDQRGKSG